MSSTQIQLVLGSTSKYRAELLDKLGIPYLAMAPICDEDSYKQSIKNPLELAETLAYQKALSLKAPGRVVIGGDQLVSFSGQILGKPKTKEKAFAQLSEMSGKMHELITSVSLVSESKTLTWTNKTLITLRSLTSKDIENYLAADEPLDCAGSYKIEKNGIRLMQKIETEDFTAIQGLPLIQLHQHLKNFGF